MVERRITQRRHTGHDGTQPVVWPPVPSSN
jgi:hypothetical protein